MPHGLVVGMSGHGKTRLVRDVLLPQWKRQGFPIALCAPEGVIELYGSVAQFATRDPRELLRVARASQRLILLIDEVNQTICRDHQTARECEYFSTASRNQGHMAVFICQRSIMLTPNYRVNCEWGYLFKQGAGDAQILSEMYGQDCSEVATLTRGNCLHVAQSGARQRLRPFPDLS